MKSRTVVIFSLFILVSIVFTIFVYFYRTETGKLIKEYTDKITTCGNLVDEKDCYNNNYCEGIYSPTCPDCNDLEFKRCKEVPDKFLVLIEKEKAVCLQTDGQWHRNKLGNFCLCQKPGVDKIWDKEKGCVNNN